MHLNLAEKYEFKLAPTYIALKLGSSNLCSIKISKSSVDMNFSRDKGLRFLKKQGLDIQTFPKVRGFRIIRIEDIHEFEQCREHILDYLRKCRG